MDSTLPPDEVSVPLIDPTPTSPVADSPAPSLVLKEENRGEVPLRALSTLVWPVASEDSDLPMGAEDPLNRDEPKQLTRDHLMAIGASTYSGRDASMPPTPWLTD